MKIAKMKTRATIRVVSMGAILLSGCTNKEAETEYVCPEENVTPHVNADGNYNIIFILNDQEHFMREYPIGSDFKGRERMRRIGTTFENHYICSNVSTPSRSAIYTGMHITQTQMLDNTNYLFQSDMNPDLTTVGDMFRAANYYTAYKGKWHLSRNVTTLEPYGFSDFGSQGDRHGSGLEGHEQDGNIANEAIRWLNEKGAERNQAGQSFFLAVNFINPHDIMYYSDSNEKKSVLEVNPPPATPLYAKTYPITAIPASWNQPVDEPGRPMVHQEYYLNWNRMTGHTPITTEGWEKFRDYYYNCIQDSDEQLQKLLNTLAEKGLLNNTIIVMTSDHGEMMGAHGLKGKAGFMYENNIHVPLVIYHPEYKGNRRCQSITSHLDIAPTLIDLTNAPLKQSITAPLKGYSMVPLLNNTTASIRDEEGALFVFDMISMIDRSSYGTPGENNFKFNIHNRGFLRGIITKEYKFARYFSPIEFNTPTTLDALYAQNDVELYRKPGDEMTNLAFDPVHTRSNPWLESLVANYNEKLNHLIAKEVGTDNGSETNAYPGGVASYAK